MVLEGALIIPPQAFTNLNHSSLSKLLHLYSPKYKSTEPSIESTLYQSHNCSMVTYFFAPRFHWYPDIPFADSLHNSRTCLHLLISVSLWMRWVYLILSSTSISYVISRYLNTTTVRLCIVRITAGHSWSNVFMYRELLLTRFSCFPWGLSHKWQEFILLLLIQSYHHPLFHRSR